MSTIFSSQVLGYSYQVDAIFRLNFSGLFIHAHLVGNGPISATVLIPTSEIPLLDGGRDPIDDALGTGRIVAVESKKMTPKI